MNIKFLKSTPIIFFVFSLFGNLSPLLWGYTAVFIHEGAHLASCILSGEKVTELRFGIWGMNLKIENTINTNSPYIIWASGPMMSFFVFMVFLLFEKYNFFMFANLCIAAVNLIPALPLDGGMLLKIFLMKRIGIIRAGKIIMKISSFFCLLGTTFIFICFSMGIFNISFFIFIPMLILSQKSSRALLLRDKKAVLSGEIRCRNKFKYIATDSSSELLAVAELISPSHKLYVAVFEGEKFIGAMTQEDIISAIMKKGALERIGECKLH